MGAEVTATILATKLTLRATCHYCTWAAEITAPPVEGADFLRRQLIAHVEAAHADTPLARTTVTDRIRTAE